MSPLARPYSTLRSNLKQSCSSRNKILLRLLVTLFALLLGMLPVSSFALTGDEWRTQYFGAVDNSGNAADMADGDLDKMPNLIEYALNQDPTKKGVTWGALSVEGNYLALRYTRRKAALDECNFQCMWAADANAAWSSTGVTETILTDDGSLQLCKATVPNTGNRKMLRLQVSRVAAPTAVTVEVISTTQLKLVWSYGTTPVTGFKFQRRVSGQSFPAGSTSVASNGRFYSDTGLTSGTQYVYEIWAENGTAKSPRVQARGTTQGTTPPPSGEKPTLWASPPWALTLPADAGLFVRDGLIGFVNNGPVIARFFDTGAGTILWAEGFEGRGLDQGPYTAARNFGVGQGQFKPGGWVNAGGGMAQYQMWYFADGDPRTGWRPSQVVFQVFHNDELVRDPSGAVQMINGGPVFARVDRGIIWGESFEGQGYSASRSYPHGSGSFKPGGWLGAGGMYWRTATQFAESDPR